MTGTVIMAGSAVVNAKDAAFPLDALAALCGFCAGSYLGGALMAMTVRSRRTRPLAKLQYVLVFDAIFLCIATILLHFVGVASVTGRCATAFHLAFAMGVQMSGQTGLGVPDMLSPLATGYSCSIKLPKGKTLMTIAQQFERHLWLAKPFYTETKTCEEQQKVGYSVYPFCWRHARWRFHFDFSRGAGRRFYHYSCCVGLYHGNERQKELTI